MSIELVALMVLNTATSSRELSFKTFDKLSKEQQTKVVDNKTLGKNLLYTQEYQDEFDKGQYRKEDLSEHTKAFYVSD